VTNLDISQTGLQGASVPGDTEPLYFEDIRVGTSLPERRVGPMTVAHIMRWSSAMENWHRIHYDWRFATGHERLPDVMVNGSWKQNLLIKMLFDWVGETGWLAAIDFQFRAMNVPGDILSPWGKVTEVKDGGDFGIVRVDIGLLNQHGVDSTPGSGLVVMQKRGGRAVPYPFDPSAVAGLEIPDLGDWKL
jgi:acyl dehydratase